MCIFCNIINKDQHAQIVFEDQKVMAFKDINPKAPVHILVVPKKHLDTINDATQEDLELLGSIILSAKKIAHELDIDDGYKLMFNVGRKGGQVVDHIHLHLLGGWKDNSTE
jgi:histidine triad (HIT) family protein